MNLPSDQQRMKRTFVDEKRISGGDFILAIFISEQLLNRTWKCDSSTRLQNCSRSDTWWDCLLHLWLCTWQPKSFYQETWGLLFIHVLSRLLTNTAWWLLHHSRVCTCSRHRQQFLNANSLLWRLIWCFIIACHTLRCVVTDYLKKDWFGHRMLTGQ